MMRQNKKRKCTPGGELTRPGNPSSMEARSADSGEGHPSFVSEWLQQASNATVDKRSVKRGTGNAETIWKPEHVGDLDWDWTLTTDHVDEWQRICRRCWWNIFMSYEEVSRWIWRLPGLLALTGGRAPKIFPWKEFPDYENFLNNVKRKLLVSRTRTEYNTENLGVPLHVYHRRKEIVSVIDEVGDKKIELNELKEWYLEWNTFYERFYKGESISDDEEKKWLKRCTVIEAQNEKTYGEFEEGVMLMDFYIGVSSGLRELRNSKEAQEQKECVGHQFEDKESSSTIGDNNDTLNMYRGSHRGHNSQTRETTTRKDPLSPKLDLLPNLALLPTPEARKAKGGKMKKIREEEETILICNEKTVDGGLQHIKSRVTETLQKGALMNGVHDSYLMDILEELSNSVQAVINLRNTIQPLTKKNTRASVTTHSHQIVDQTKPIMVDKGTYMDLTPSWWKSLKKYDGDDHEIKEIGAEKTDQRLPLWNQMVRRKRKKSTVDKGDDSD